MIGLRSRIARVLEHRTQERMRQTVMNRMSHQLAREFRRLADDAVARPHAIEHVITDHESRLAPILSWAYRQIFTVFASRTLARIVAKKPAKSFEQHEIECKAAVEDTYADAVAKFTKRWTAAKATQISNTSKTKIERVIRNGATEGLSDKEVADQIQEKVGGSMGDRRAMTIARTETHSASQDASFEIIQTTGIDVTKEWVSVEDKRTRDDHVEANGQEVAMHDYFQVGEDELLYPGDPSGSAEEIINCRCVAVYNPA